MNFQELLDKFAPVTSGSWISADIIFWRMLFTAVFAFLLSAITYLTYTGKEYERSVMHSQIIVTVVASLIINVIGDNIARAFGLFGALSFIRFRTTLRDSKDTAVFFYSVAAGMACGLGQFDLALASLFIVAPILVILRFLPVGITDRTIIKFHYTDFKTAKTVIAEYFKMQKIPAQFIASSVKSCNMTFRVDVGADLAFDKAFELQKQNAELIDNFSLEAEGELQD